MDKLVCRNWNWNCLKGTELNFTREANTHSTEKMRQVEKTITKNKFFIFGQENVTKNLLNSSGTRIPFNKAILISR